MGDALWKVCMSRSTKLRSSLVDVLLITGGSSPLSSLQGSWKRAEGRRMVLGVSDNPQLALDDQRHYDVYLTCSAVIQTSASHPPSRRFDSALRSSDGAHRLAEDLQNIRGATRSIS